MERIWLKQYPAGVPADIDVTQYSSLVELLEESFKKFSDRKAFICMDKSISYRDLDEMSQALGAYLQSKGLAKGARVALMMPNVLQYPVSTAAVLRAGYAVGEEHDPELFHRLHTATAARQAFDAVTPGNIKAQWDCLASTGNCAMFVARRDGVAAGGIWLTSFAGTVTYKLAGWDASVKAPNANELLHWTAMQWARARGAHTYDLGGIDRTNAERLIAGLPPAEGFERTPSFFKQRFGGAPVLLPRARFVFTNGVLNAAGGWAAQRALSSDMLHRLANRLRNGRS